MSASGRSSRIGDSCPVLARQCWAPGSPRGPGRLARSPSHCWSAWNELACNRGSDSRPRAIQWHRVSHEKAFLKLYSPLITAHSYRCRDSRDVTAVTTTHVVVRSPVKSSGMWHTRACKCHLAALYDKRLLCLRFISLLPSSVFAVWSGLRCDSRFRCHSIFFPPPQMSHCHTSWLL